MKALQQGDPKIFNLIKAEEKRQKDYLAMIPSENYASAAVREAVGSVLMNKYAEGQALKRYYQGNVNVDAVELECKARVLKVFGLSNEKWGANVQPHSGSPANIAVYVGLLQPGDRAMGMYLPDGGHLSHGWELPDRKISFTSQAWQWQPYHVDPKTKVFDYEQIRKQAKKWQPKILVSGGTAYPREINHKAMGSIAKEVGAYYLADVSHEAGLIAAGVNKSPFAYADVVTFTTHKTLRGPRGAVIVARKELMDKVDFAVFPALQGGPHEHTIAGIAVALKEATTPAFRKYAAQILVNAQVLVKDLKQAGYDIVSGGTDKHLVLIDLRKQQLSGWVAAWALEFAGIILNRNTVPYDTASPYYPSGLRMGTPALTSRGMKEKEMHKIAAWIIQVLDHIKDERLPEDKVERAAFVKAFRPRMAKDRFLAKIKKEVFALTKKFPVPGIDK